MHFPNNSTSDIRVTLGRFVCKPHFNPLIRLQFWTQLVIWKSIQDNARVLFCDSHSVGNISSHFFPPPPLPLCSYNDNSRSVIRNVPIKTQTTEHRSESWPVKARHTCEAVKLFFIFCYLCCECYKYRFSEVRNCISFCVLYPVCFKTAL